ncbi:uncharacterized protein LOC142219517 [Haematobia irritans]|uniref:uncharacterized protein LOC142219517 n=1 Tax=Haematobia irritans TaxID=7368 RepID=UPI003F508187
MAHNFTNIHKKTFEGSGEFKNSKNEEFNNKLDDILKNQALIDAKLDEILNKLKLRKCLEEENKARQSKMMAVLKQLVNKNSNVGPPIDFPVKSFEDMEAVNLKIADDVEKYVAIIEQYAIPVAYTKISTECSQCQ